MSNFEIYVRPLRAVGTLKSEIGKKVLEQITTFLESELLAKLLKENPETLSVCSKSIYNVTFPKKIK